MAWVRLDDHFPDHPKIVSAGPLGAWLYVAGLCYCNRLLTNGFIPISQVDRLAPHREDQDIRDRPLQLAQRLCALDLWAESERKGVLGFVVHDFLKYQPSKKQVVTERAKSAIRQGRFRNGHRHGRHHVSSNGVSNGDSNAISNVGGNAAPDPDPDPDPYSVVLERVYTSADADFEVFRQAYPASRRVGGTAGQNSFRRALRRQGADLPALLSVLEQHKRSEQWQTPKLIPLMTTWLNQERWLQVLPEAPRKIGARPAVNDDDPL